MYGIPNPIPRTIKSKPSTNAKTGTSFVIFLLMLRLINFPKIVAANIVGTVPNPNKIITAEPEIASPLAIAPARRNVN